MDFSTSHTAYSLHIQDAQRAEQEHKRLRIIREPAAERGTGVVDPPVVRHHVVRHHVVRRHAVRHHRGVFAVLAAIRSRRAAAL